MALTNPRELCVRFDLADELETNRLYIFHAMVLDSAGNPSNQTTAKFWVIPDTMKFHLALYDVVDTVDSEYTSSPTVRTEVTTPVPAEFMRFSTDPEDIYTAEWLPYERISTFSFPDGVNEQKWLWCQIMQGGYLSPVDSSSIILDTIQPTFDNIQVSDPETGDEDWSGSYRVKVEAINPNDLLPGQIQGLLLAEDENFTRNVQFLTFPAIDEPYVYYEFTPQEEAIEGVVGNQRIVYAKLLDRAENPSELTATDSIVVDVQKKEHFVNFPNPFNPLVEKTTIRSKGDGAGEKITVDIYDPFGQLVWSKELTSSSRLEDIVWDGKNDVGKIVANGSYICIIERNEKTVKGKIGVWKGE